MFIFQFIFVYTLRHIGGFPLLYLHYVFIDLVMFNYFHCAGLCWLSFNVSSESLVIDFQSMPYSLGFLTMKFFLELDK